MKISACLRSSDIQTLVTVIIDDPAVLRAKKSPAQFLINSVRVSRLCFGALLLDMLVVLYHKRKKKTPGCLNPWRSRPSILRLRVTTTSVVEVCERIGNETGGDGVLPHLSCFPTLRTYLLHLRELWWLNCNHRNRNECDEESGEPKNLHDPTPNYFWNQDFITKNKNCKRKRRGRNPGVRGC